MARSIKIQKLEPALINREVLKRYFEPDYVVKVFGSKGDETFAVFAKDNSESFDAIESKMRNFARDYGLITITGKRGTGTNELFGKRYVQFFLRTKPKKITKVPQAVPTRPSEPLTNNSSPVPPVQPTTAGADDSKKPQQRFQEKNRLGWSKDAYRKFYSIGGPNGDWTLVKKNFSNPSAKQQLVSAVNSLYSLFRVDAPYIPLAQMFAEMRSLAERNDVDKMRTLISRIQPRIQRLYDFARTEALAKSIVVKSLKRRLI